jgi:hypothetical protein
MQSYKLKYIYIGAPRLVINYKPLNKVLEWIRYPIPNKRDLINRLSGFVIFSKFDMKSGFWQIQNPPPELYIYIYIYIKLKIKSYTTRKSIYLIEIYVIVYSRSISFSLFLLYTVCLVEKLDLFFWKHKQMGIYYEVLSDSLTIQDNITSPFQIASS